MNSTILIDQIEMLDPEMIQWCGGILFSNQQSPKLKKRERNVCGETSPHIQEID